MEIKAKCKYDYPTCKAIAHVHSYKKQNPVKTVVLRLALCLILALTNAYLLNSGYGSISNYIIFILIIFIAVLDGVTFFILPRLQYRSLSKMKDLGNRYVFRDEDFVAETDSEEYSGDSVIKYSFLEKVMETEKYFFLYQNKRQIFAVDKSTLEGGTAEEMRGRLKAVLGKKYVICKY